MIINVTKTFLYSIVSCGLTLCGAERPYSFGWEIFGSKPTGALATAFTSSVGMGVGLFLEKDLGAGHGLRWDLTSIAIYPGQEKMERPSGRTLGAHFSSTGTALSYTYHLSGRHKGPFVLAGLGARALNGVADVNPLLLPPQELGGHAVPAYVQYNCDTGVQLSVLLGGGYDFNSNWGVTIRYQALKSRGQILATGESGVSYRF